MGEKRYVYKILVRNFMRRGARSPWCRVMDCIEMDLKETVRVD
jgi:hypothetical protein